MMEYVHLDVHQEIDVNSLAANCDSVFGKTDFDVVETVLQIHILCFLGSLEKMRPAERCKNWQFWQPNLIMIES